MIGFFLRTYPMDANWLKKEKQIAPYKESGLVIDGWTDEAQDTVFNKLETSRTDLVANLLSQKLSLRKKLRGKEITQIETGLMEENGQFKIDEEYLGVHQR